MTTGRLPNNIPLIKCTECDEVFQKEHQQKKHIRAFHKVNIELVLPFLCSTCKRRFPLKSSFEAHLKGQGQNGGEYCKQEPLPEYCSYITGHGQGRIFKCNICNVVFKSSHDVKRHYSSVHEDDDKRTWFSCETCGRGGIKTKHGLQRHKLRYHFDGPAEKHPLKCPFDGCGKIQSSKDRLKEHEKFHRGEFGFFCTECDYKTVTIGHLNQHYKMHSNDRPHKCKQCDKSYKGSHKLKSHVLQVHTLPANRPYQCPYCDKSYGDKYGLDRHEIVHLPKMKYLKCNICEKWFVLKKYLQNHMRKFHNSVYQEQQQQKKKDKSIAFPSTSTRQNDDDM